MNNICKEAHLIDVHGHAGRPKTFDYQVQPHCFFKVVKPRSQWYECILPIVNIDRDVFIVWEGFFRFGPGLLVQIHGELSTDSDLKYI